MKKKLISALLSVAMVSALLAGCGSSAGTESLPIHSRRRKAPKQRLHQKHPQRKQPRHQAGKERCIT